MSKKKTLLKNDLNELVKKFSENDVIARMEKEYQCIGGNNLPLSLIDDNSFVKKVNLPKEAIERISEGILKQGLFNPLVVRPSGSHFELILGRKRYFGAKKVGLKEVPCIQVEAGDEETLLMLLADSRDQRESNVVEMALLFQALTDRFSYTQATLASLSHQSRSQVTNIMRLLSLPDKVLRELSDGQISYGHARAVLSCSDEEIENIIRRIHLEGLSVRETEDIVRQYSHHFPSLEEDQISLLRKKTNASSIVERKRSLTLEFPDEEEKNAFIERLLSK